MRFSHYRNSKGVVSRNSKIPVFINTFNRLTTTKVLVNQISAFEHARPIIVDNKSTWRPLLEWYESDPCEIIRLGDNFGSQAIWKANLLNQIKSDWYVVTDCDLDLSGVPLDVLDHLKIPFQWKNIRLDKAGLALRIWDLPEWQHVVREWESKFWKHPVPFDTRFYFADIDTTFALYRKSSKIRCARCVRAAGVYSAKHVPWYLDCTTLDEENRNYYLTASEENSWKPHGRYLSGRIYCGDFCEKI